MNNSQREAIAKEVEDITIANGGVLTPEDAVEAAKSEKSAMHDYFEWDDTVAGHQHRLAQARALFKTIRVEIKTEVTVLSAPKYIRDPSAEDRAQGYREVVEVRTKADLSRDAMAGELKRARAYLHRSLAIAQALGMDAEILMLVESLDALSDRLEAVA